MNRFELTASAADNRAQIADARVAIIGAARSGVALANLLVAAGAKVLVSDSNNVTVATMSQHPDIRWEFGSHSPAVLAADLICISPGIPTNTPLLQQAVSCGIPLTGELEAASWFCDAPVTAVTGSNGKTTTTLLIHDILQQRYKKVLLGGNIGDPLAGELLKEPSPEQVLLEVSSFQLETMHTLHPRIAVFTNLSPNHLDRYDSYESYIATKMRLLENLQAADTVVYCADDVELSGRIAGTAARKLPFSLETRLDEGVFWSGNQLTWCLAEGQGVLPVFTAQLRGPHNRLNMAAAAAVGLLHQADEQQLVASFSNFPGVEHRLEKVGCIDGVDFVNDSKATTAASLSFALRSFDNPLVLIAGGVYKGGDFSGLRKLLEERVRAVVLIGEAAWRLEEAWQGACPIVSAFSMQEAVDLALALAGSGDTVLLSPGCSSFDMFSDYEDRGRQFKMAVAGKELFA